MQTISPTAQAGGEHMPPEQSCIVAHGSPLLSQPLRSALQICGWAPAHCRWFKVHVGAVHVPVEALQSAAVAQGPVPMLFQPVWPALQTSGCAPLQRVCPGVHAAALQVPVAALQSAAVAHGEPEGSQPF